MWLQLQPPLEGTRLYIRLGRVAMGFAVAHSSRVSVFRSQQVPEDEREMKLFLLKT